MQENGVQKHTRFLVLIAIYVVGAYIPALQTGFYFVFYSLLPPCLAYLFYRNNLGRIKIFSAILLLAMFLFVNLGAKIAIFFYTFMTLACLYIIEKLDASLFKKLITFILVMIITALLLFFISEKISDTPSFFESLNDTFTNKEAIAEINQVLKESMGEDAIDFEYIDRTTLRLALSSLVSIFVFDMVGLVSSINFFIIANIMKRRNKKIQKIKPFWEMGIPKKFILVIFMMFLITYVFKSQMGDFGYGIVITFIVILFQLYSVQGIFVLSFAINKTKISLMLHIPLLIIIVLALSLSGLGGFLIFNLGLIDAIFNLRRLPKGEK